jgi:hypothetical protein
MDDDIPEDLVAQKACIEAEIRKRRRANAKARKEEEEHMLIVAGEGKVSFGYQITTAKFYSQGLEKRRKRHSKMPVSIFHLLSLNPLKTYILAWYEAAGMKRPRSPNADNSAASEDGTHQGKSQTGKGMCITIGNLKH